MTAKPGRPAPSILIAIVAIVVVADAALYKQVFDKFGTTFGTIFMIAGSLFVGGCLYMMERRA